MSTILESMAIDLRHPISCYCCHQPWTAGGNRIGYLCACEQLHDCSGCHRCWVHCTCPEGPTQDFDEALRRWRRAAVASTEQSPN